MDDSRLPLSVGTEDKSGDIIRGDKDKEELKAIAKTLKEIAHELNAINKTLNAIKGRV